jgi:hypothetical protein
MKEYFSGLRLMGVLSVPKYPIGSLIGCVLGFSALRQAPLAQLAEQQTLNLRVQGSSPWRRTLDQGSDLAKRPGSEPFPGPARTVDGGAGRRPRGVRLSADRFAELATAERQEPVPDWLPRVASHCWQVQLAGLTVEQAVLVRRQPAGGYARASWEITLGCNWRCGHCYLGEKKATGGLGQPGGQDPSGMPEWSGYRSPVVRRRCSRDAAATAGRHRPEIVESVRCACQAGDGSPY